ncbi:putative phage protein (predicted DNA packaging) [Aneurinibacillus soli]|uniref:Phage gp6-like head-tail connector protein n=1 Tax=Aneurinibacillus soli TaxID=1500254 RepID=A0A0U5B9M7_9BACL|nr:head-tail connector protein [Aneurinibacillus soli]PYE63440.1 putative phage protein (predicted DNA packaging) [Aneurinibacillus soli]BAU27628.1 Phage gp6-like head-tail connector protein [Aneurinibacillus soli]
MAGPALDELKTYLRIDGSEDDMILELLTQGAIEYLANAGVPESESALYKLGVMLYVALHYENRDPSMRMDKFSFALESIILQLEDYR